MDLSSGEEGVLAIVMVWTALGKGQWLRVLFEISLPLNGRILYHQEL
jgi:hypothetical protein